MDECSDLGDHISEFNLLVSQLSSIDVKLEEEDQAILLLSSLPKSYETLKTTLLIGKETLLVDDVMSALMDSSRVNGTSSSSQGEGLVVRYENKNGHGRGRGRSKSRNSGHGNDRSKSRGKQDKSSIECWYCKEIGHIARRCPERKEKKNGKKHVNNANVAEEDDKSSDGDLYLVSSVEQQEDGSTDEQSLEDPEEHPSDSWNLVRDREPRTKKPTQSKYWKEKIEEETKWTNQLDLSSEPALGEEPPVVAGFKALLEPGLDLLGCCDLPVKRLGFRSGEIGKEATGDKEMNCRRRRKGLPAVGKDTRVMERGSTGDGGLTLKHIKTGDNVSVSRRVVAIFLTMTMADFSDQLFGFQDNLFENSDGRLEFIGNNFDALWPGDCKPGLWMNSISRMGVIYTLIEKKREQIVARDLYWEAVCQVSKRGLEGNEEMLKSCIEKNPFVGEPHVVLSQIYLSKGRFEEAEKEAEKGLRLMLEWGSPWDKRTSWEGWIAWTRVLLMKAKERSWPRNSWGFLSLGLVK
ncbi:hypothetical protein RJ640_020570 [Escallonia rubra]|uniref:CCHC-type domain-containing protein n=1 Tax=Escallonia rubra TaxID=112253 RepID=A0AA88QPF8_9ASTE|nr:hypothetical protein RJ640_020570 [Escallonia rubra]